MPEASTEKTGSNLPPYEKLLLARIVFGVSDRNSSIADAFSGWLMAGFGGAVALIVSNENTISERLPSGRIDWILLLFAASTVAGLIAKWHAVFVARLVGGIEALLEVLAENDREEEKRGVDLPLPPLDLFKRLILETVPGPVRRFVERKVGADGDILDTARDCARRTFWQSSLTVAQVVFFAAALAVIVWPRC